MNLRSIFLALALISYTSFNVTAQVKKAGAPAVKKVVVPATKTVVATAPARPSKETAGNTKVKITTDMGVIIVRLYDSTPKHRDNFVKLVGQKFYDSLLFHRIIHE